MEPPGNLRQRPRPILSCLECRRKKLKCDRSQPCNQCLKIKRPDDCVFNHFASDNTQSSSQQDEGHLNVSETARKIGTLSTANANFSRVELDTEGPNKRPRVAVSSHLEPPIKTGVVEDLQARVEKIERLLGQSAPSNNVIVRRESNSLYRLGPGDTQKAIHGHNHRSTLLSPFEEAQRFLYHLPNDPTFKPYIQRVRRFQKSLKSTAAKERYSGSDGDGYGETLPSMENALPPKETCDHIVESYTMYAEKTLRILHLPTFLSQYANYWDDDRNETQFGFLPQLLAVIAAATGSSTSSLRPAAALPVSRTVLLKIVERWHDGLKRKERLTMTALQTKTLLLLSSHNIFLPTDLTWNATGSLVRYAMSVGLHRDASNYNDISPIEGEIRRRLWASILEMDLQSSLVWGMPTMSRQGDWDTQPPSNLDDSELSNDLIELPASKPLAQWTDSLLQVILARSLPQRLSTAIFITAADIRASDEERHMHGNAIEQLLREIPLVAKTNVYIQQKGDKARSASETLGRVLLDINIRRLLLYLYRPFALQVSEEDIFFRSRRICRDSALVILSHQDTFEPHSPDLEGTDTDEVWGLFETHCRHDVLLAALTICWEIRMMSINRSRDEISQREELQLNEVNYGDNASSMPWTKTRLIRTVEDALSGLTEKLDKPGGFLKDVLGLAVVLQSVKSNVSTDRKEYLMRKGAIDVAEAFLHRVQANESNEAAEMLRPQPQDMTPASYQGSVSDNGVLYQAGFPTSFDGYDINMMTNNSLGLDNMDFDFSSGWDLF